MQMGTCSMLCRRYDYVPPPQFSGAIVGVLFGLCGLLIITLEYALK